MATKNLARTAIEGGRTGRSKYERRHANRIVRSEQRAFLSRIANDVEEADDTDVASFHEAIPHNYREFNDKLTPVRRWMDKQVGRAWDEVHSELRVRFDSRTIAGQHILFDHMLNDVDPHPYVTKYSLFGVGSYFVDEKGTLRKRAEYRRHYRIEKRTVPENELIAWRSDRYVSEVGSELFWLQPTYIPRQILTINPPIPTGAYRQGNKLSKSERAFYDRLKDFEKRLVLLPEKK